MTPEAIKAQFDALNTTPEAVRAQVSALAKLANRDEQDLYDCSLEEMTLLAKVYHDAAAPTERTAFSTFLSVLGLAALVAAPIATVATALSSLFGVITAARAL